MFRIVLLIMVFMVAIFTLVTNLAAKKTGRQGVNIFHEVGSGIVHLLNGADRIAPNLSGAISRVEVNLPKVKLGSEDEGEWEAPNLAGVDFSGQKHQNENFAGAIMPNAIFINALLDGANFEGASGAGVVMKKAALSGARFDAALLPRADFSDASLRAATLRAADVGGADFAKADLAFARLTSANASGANFSGAELNGAQFQDATLSGANFTGADAATAGFKNANLSGAVFAGAKIDQADFAGANIRSADFTLALGATPETFANACGDAKTKLPDGLTAPVCAN